MPDLKEKIDKLVNDFVKAVDEVEKDVEEKDSKAYKNFMDYDNSYLSDTDAKSSENKVDFPKENEFMYFVKGYGDEKSQVFTSLDEAKAYAIEKNKFLFEINGSDFYKNPIDLKSLKQIDLTKEKPKKESVLGKIADYKKEGKNPSKPKAEKNKDIGVEI